MDYENLELPDDVSEVVEAPEEISSEPISSVSEEVADQSAEQESPKYKEEPGYVKGRVEKAVTKARSEMQAQYEKQISDLKAEYDAKFAPLMERMLEMDAQDLVRSGKVKDLELAKELVRLRNGQPAPEKVEQPRQANGQFAPKTDPATQARIDMLDHQAKRIMETTGVDVTAEFMSNPEIKQKVVTGEMDFYEVAEQMQQSKKRPPSPMRSPNGAVGQNPNAIDSMTPEQFARMQKRIDEGARFGLI